MNSQLNDEIFILSTAIFILQSGKIFYYLKYSMKILKNFFSFRVFSMEYICLPRASKWNSFFKTLWVNICYSGRWAFSLLLSFLI